MTISRTRNPDDPALMTIHFTSPSTAATTPPPVSSTTTPQTSTAPVTPSKSPAPTERTEVFNIKNRQRYEILEQLMTLTNAKKIEPTEKEINEIRELGAKRETSAKDSTLGQKVAARRKQEARRMAIARGELKAEN
jgi:large subunit ribosomal protein MRP49